MHRRRFAWRQWFRRATIPAIATVLAGLITGGVVALAASDGDGDQVACAPGQDLVVRAGGSWSCGSEAGPTAGPTAGPSASTSPTPGTTPTTDATQTSGGTQTFDATQTTTGPTATSPATSTTSQRPTSTPSRTRCFEHLAECGYPTVDTTGVPNGVRLTPYTGPTTITAAGTVIDGKSMGCVFIRASNVVIRNSKITGPCAFGVHVDSGSVTVEDTDIDCVDHKGMGIAFRNFQARRVHVQRCENGFHVGSNTTIVDSYITGVVEVDGGHGDGIQASSGSNILIRHNTFDLRNPITSSIIMANLTISNMTVEDNFFAAGAYTVYCPASPSNVVYRNNRFYGPVGSWPSDTHRPAFGFSDGCRKAGITWTGNYRDDTLAAI